MQEQFNRLRTTAVISFVSLAIIGGALCLFPNQIVKALGSFFTIASIGCVGATQFLVDSGERIAEKALKASESKELGLLKDLKSQSLENAKLYSQLEAKSQALAQMTEQLAQTQSTITSLASTKSKLEQYAARLQQSCSQLQTQASQDKERIEYMEAEIGHWEKNFQSMVETEADKRFKIAKNNEIQQIFDEHDAITIEAMQLFRELQAWGIKVASGHQSKREIIKSMASAYNKNIDELSIAVNKERETYLEQIELLNMRIAQLQHELAGDLLEPIKSNKAGLYYALVDYFIDDFYIKTGIPLRFLALDIKEDSALASIGYSKSADAGAIVSMLKANEKRWIKDRGIHSIEEMKAEKLYPAITFRIRRDALHRDEKSLFRSQDDLRKLIANSRIFYRLIGKPESGKSPTALIAIDTILKTGGMKEFNTPKGRLLTKTVIEFCNPVAFSNKTSDDLKPFEKWDDFDEAFSDLWQEYNFRRDKKNANYKDNVGYLWICDEFDNGVRNSDNYDAKKLQSITSDGGHANMGLIVLGQGVNVSKAKIQREDVKMFLNIILDSVSMRTFFENNASLVYDDATIADAKVTLAEIEKIAESKNRTIVDTARKFRFCMVTEDRSLVFYQLPYFDEYDFDWTALEQTKKDALAMRLNRNIQSLSISNNLENESKREHPKNYRGEYACPECEHDSISYVDLTTKGTPRYKCDNCGCKKVISKFDKIN